MHCLLLHANGIYMVYHVVTIKESKFCSVCAVTIIISFSLLLHCRYGYPEPHISAHSYTDHSLTYDRSKKIPVWVAECINKDMVTSRLAKRARSEFQPDPKLPQEYCSSNTDYRGSGWSRGHMAPAGNYKHCQNSMDDTFLLTNIVPQNLDNNSG